MVEPTVLTSPPEVIPFSARCTMATLGNRPPGRYPPSGKVAPATAQTSSLG